MPKTKTSGSGSRSSPRKSASSPSGSAPRAASARAASPKFHDYEEFLAAFGSRGVRYLVGGAHALALYARPRATKDLDLFLEPSAANARRAALAIQDFFGGVSPSYADAAALMDPATIVQLGVAPIRIDILSTFELPKFRAAWKRRTDTRFGSVDAHFLSLDDLIDEKERWARPQDLVDLIALRRARSALLSRPPRPRGPKVTG